MSLLGTYVGIVEDNKDPEKLGRVKVRVPHVYGAVGGVFGTIPTNTLPWALPLGLPAGGSNASGGLSMLPEPGDQVAVQFLDGEPEKPCWQWLMQTQSQAKTLKLHEYGQSAQSAVGAPDRAILTRYGHSLELKDQQVTLTTAEGQQVLLQTSQSTAGGSAALQTPKGQSVTVNDLSESVVVQALNAMVISGQRVMINAPTSTLVKTERFTVLAGSSLITVQGNTILVTTGSGASVVIDDNGNVAISSAGGACLSVENDQVQLGDSLGTGMVIGSGQLSVNAEHIVMNTAAFSVGTATGYPVLMLTPQMLAWLVGHTHTNGNDGSPTGPPIPMDPLFPTDSASTRMQTT